MNDISAKKSDESCINGSNARLSITPKATPQSRTHETPTLPACTDARSSTAPAESPGKQKQKQRSKPKNPELARMSKKGRLYPEEDLNLTEDEVVERYAPLLKHHLENTTKHLPLTVKLPIMDDLHQEAKVALLLCWRAYLKTPSHKRNGNFLTMSYKRIRGSIIDYYRDRRDRTVHTADFISWEEHDFEQHIKTEMEDHAEEQERSAVITAAIAKLDLWERRFIHLHYNMGKTGRAIAEMTGVTESRICQLHNAILLRLRHFIGCVEETVGG